MGRLDWEFIFERFCEPLEYQFIKALWDALDRQDPDAFELSKRGYSDWLEEQGSYLSATRVRQGFVPGRGFTGVPAVNPTAFPFGGLVVSGAVASGQIGASYLASGLGHSFGPVVSVRSGAGFVPLGTVASGGINFQPPQTSAYDDFHS